MPSERFEKRPASQKPDQERRREPLDPELLAVLKQYGLTEAAVLAVIPNEVLDTLGPQERRLAHALLEAGFQLQQPQEEEQAGTPSSQENEAG